MEKRSGGMGKDSTAKGKGKEAGGKGKSGGGGEEKSKGKGKEAKGDLGTCTYVKGMSRLSFVFEYCVFAFLVLEGLGFKERYNQCWSGL